MSACVYLWLIWLNSWGICTFLQHACISGSAGSLRVWLHLWSSIIKTQCNNAWKVLYLNKKTSWYTLCHLNKPLTILWICCPQIRVGVNTALLWEAVKTTNLVQMQSDAKMLAKLKDELPILWKENRWMLVFWSVFWNRLDKQYYNSKCICTTV